MSQIARSTIMFGKRHVVSDLTFPPRLGTKVRCIVEPDGKIWTKGLFENTLIVPREGLVYTIRGNIRSSQLWPLPIAVGVLLMEVVNKPILLRKDTEIEPFFLRECFRLISA